jgi:hypothetical protein
MEQNNNNIIKPVERLPNVGSVTHAEKQGEKKQQKNLRKQKERQQEPIENILNTTVTAKDDHSENNRDGHSIDYCA